MRQPTPELAAARCSIDDCSRPAYARGMCCAHYKRHLKARPAGTAQPRQARPATDPTKTTHTTPAELLAALAAAVPPLHGSRCRGRADLFDATIDGQRGHHDDTLTARAAALAICGTCPALQPCRAWFDRLDPAQRPLGVIAGQLVTASA